MYTFKAKERNFKNVIMTFEIHIAMESIFLNKNIPVLGLQMKLISQYSNSSIRKL